MSHRRFFPIVRWILGAQALGVLLMVALSLLLKEPGSSLSVLFGGIVAIVPNLVFSLGIGVRDDRRSARQVTRLLYGGEMLKLVLTAALFALAFHVPGIQLIPLMVGFVGALTVFWVALLVRGSLT